METKNLLNEALIWIHHTLLVIGLVSTFIFVKVNFWGKDVTLQTPSYAMSQEDPLDYYQEAPRKNKNSR